LIASSSADSITSSDIKNGLSLWTSYIVEELGKDEINDIEESLKNVRNNMRKDGHRQIPWESQSFENKLYF